MQKKFIKLLKKLRQRHIQKYGLPQHRLLCRETDPNIIADQIRKRLLSPEPCMLSRFGAVEIGCVVNYLGVYRQKRKIIKYIKGEAFPWWWEEDTMYPMRNNAGFFSATPELLKRFSEMMIEDMPLIDILASWRFEEEYFSKELQHTYKIDFEPYNPFWSDVPWTTALESKKVLVVHPFAETIQKQYLRKELIHKDPRVLPTFDLQTIKAIQTIGNQSDSRFETWFDALEFMKSEIDKRDYDVCLLGCGAYGMPLAAHVKRSGKKAVHIGGSLQLLFGIRGARWENSNYNATYNYSKLMNEYWVKPSETETPQKARQVEEGCYW
ncbi:hypothetical protein [uncultured Bacteroides sp.]|uniref:hypothetical protein n=1 Tax=uncultured Bacteroides sp. TaxID=162156 RepID=UPI0025E3B387|nr:hypothetical protein [uncultured Bacteroides sp.]